MEDRNEEKRDFFKLFMMENDIGTIVEAYQEIRKQAILDKGYYEELFIRFKKILGQKQLRESDVFQNHSWKHYLSNCFLRLVGLFRKNASADDINEEICNLLESAQEKMRESQYKHAHMYLILDIIWAYSEDREKFQRAAMINDVITNMNEQDWNLRKFYGEEVNEIILKHTFDCIQIYSKEYHKTSSEYIETFLCQMEEDYLESFRIKLRDLAEQEFEQQKTEKEQQKQQERLQKIRVQIVLVLVLVIASVIGGIIFGQFFLKDKETPENKEQIETQQNENEMSQNSQKESENDMTENSEEESESDIVGNSEIDIDKELKENMYILLIKESIRATEEDRTDNLIDFTEWNMGSDGNSDSNENTAFTGEAKILEVKEDWINVEVEYNREKKKGWIKREIETDWIAVHYTNETTGRFIDWIKIGETIE